MQGGRNFSARLRTLYGSKGAFRRGGIVSSTGPGMGLVPTQDALMKLVVPWFLHGRTTTLLRSGFLVWTVMLGADHATAADASGSSQPFDYAWLKGQARSLAEQPYKSREGEIPAVLQRLSWDDYQALRFDRQQALWTSQNPSNRFRAELFHLGLYFRTPVQIHLLENGQARPMVYEPSLFEYGDSGIDPDDLPEDLGFAGFRYHFHTDWARDVFAFLGASYFRAVGSELQYGLSARGLAIDTAEPGGEEFPVFTDFWLQKPTSGSDTVTLYALLDSPSITGAYRFDITPGPTLKMSVDVALYPRTSIQRLGIAPLTSMYMVGENDRRADWDWRPEIHDSDGLLMHSGHGEWIWRPLVNPPELRFNAYGDTDPRGFGLLQRDQAFANYQDDGVFYHRRPGVWVRPLGDWGAGSVQLVEIPTVDETFDNIVAFWNPDRPIKAGQEWLFSYELHWGTQRILPRSLGRVEQTFTGLGGVVGQRRNYYSKRFVVDFSGDVFDMLGPDAGVEPVIQASDGRVEIASARPQVSLGGYRARFDVVPPEKGPDAPINLRLYLTVDGHRVTETWHYQWTPPPVEQRKLRNPEHL